MLRAICLTIGSNSTARQFRLVVLAGLPCGRMVLWGWLRGGGARPLFAALKIAGQARA
jgi:hypothetical protein